MTPRRRESVPMIIPARITPSITAKTLRLKSQSRIDAASVPVQAPVPGSGIPTKSRRAQKIPLSPAAFSSFCPPLWPFLRHQVKKPPIRGLSAPHSRTLRAKKKIIGTGSIFPITQRMRACHQGIPEAIATGTAPRSSTRGIIEIKNAMMYFMNNLS